MMIANKLFVFTFTLLLAYNCKAEVILAGEVNASSSGSTKSSSSGSIKSTGSSSTKSPVSGSTPKSKCPDGLNVTLEFPNEPLEKFLITLGEALKTSADALTGIESDGEAKGNTGLKEAIEAIMKAIEELKNKRFSTPKQLEETFAKVKEQLETAINGIAELSEEEIADVTTKANLEIVEELLPALLAALDDIKVGIDCPCAAFVSSTTTDLEDLITPSPTEKEIIFPTIEI